MGAFRPIFVCVVLVGKVVIGEKAARGSGGWQCKEERIKNT